MIDTVKLFEAKQALNKFLEENPQLKEKQKLIDKALSGAGSQHNRMIVLKFMIDENLQELRKACYELGVLASKLPTSK